MNNHTDDDAVDMFAKAMKEKLAKARAKGRSGWEQCHPNYLSQALHAHVEKGDPRDVANFCMFLWMLREPIHQDIFSAKPTPPTNESEPHEWQIEVAGPAGYVRYVTFHGQTLEGALDSAHEQGFFQACDEDGFLHAKVKVKV